jgi:phosphoglycerol transferase MdoB-like AlkP superfamily enzyme
VGGTHTDPVRAPSRKSGVSGDTSDSATSSPKVLPVRPVAAGILFTLVWAALGNAVLDVAQGVPGIVPGLRLLVHADPAVFGLSTLLLWGLLVGLVGVTGRVLLSATVLMVLVVAVAAGNRAKITLRNEPLYPADLAFLDDPGFLLDAAGADGLIVTVLVLVTTGLGAWSVSRWMRRRWDAQRWQRGGTLYRHWMVSRLLMLCLSVLLLSTVRDFHGEENRLRQSYEALGAEWVTWSPLINYERHGLVAGLLYNSEVDPMERPDGYDMRAMQALVARYSGPGSTDPAAPEASAAGADQRSPHIVAVLSESFSDPTVLPGLRLAEDPIPFTRALMERTASGERIGPMLGGGTANVEFEALTGQSLSLFEPQLTTPFQMLVAGRESYPSAAGYLEHIGYRTSAIHSYGPEMYRRGRVYDVLGFDTSTFEDAFPTGTRIDRNPFISDSATFDAAYERLHEAEGPVFTQVVTMQNHLPYDDVYDDPIRASGVSPDMGEQMAQFARGLRHSDAALARFVGALRTLDRPTTLLFYGDHVPGFWADSSMASVRGDDPTVLYKSPYFIWSTEGALRGDAPAVTSPVYFFPMLLRSAGLDLPPYYELLLRLQEELPILLPGRSLAPDREVPRQDLGRQARRLLRDYRMVQYDLSVGAGYARDELFYPTSEPTGR